ncbi:retrovirus-related pol polyprotein from transposon TNT 1-94 [Tanacetum coccineum]
MDFYVSIQGPDAAESVRDAIGFEYCLASSSGWTKVACSMGRDWESSLTGLELVPETTDKVTSWKRVVCFKKKGKLASRYVGPFEILKRIGPVAYRLRLPEELNGVHDTFHVLNLKRCLADANLHVSLDEIKVVKTLRFVEEPVEIIDREVKSLKRSRISLVKVCWNYKRGPEFTWEREGYMNSKYPQLFVDHADESAMSVIVSLLWIVDSERDRLIVVDRGTRSVTLPTGQTFTIVGNACPLTRITTTAEVPLRKLNALETDTPKHVVTLVYLRKPRKSKTNVSVSKPKIVKSISANNKEPSKSWGSIVFDVSSSSLDECRSSKLFSVAFRQHNCFIRNLEGVDLLTGSRDNNLYTLSLGDMMTSSPICLLSKASKTKSWLWHRRLAHLNFGAINHLARHGLVQGLFKLKFEKDRMCFACAMGKGKKKSYKPKSEDTNQEKLNLLHMDLCGPINVASFNEKKYILVIVDDYSRFTWVKCLRSKDEAPDFIIKFLKMIQLRLKAPVRRIRTYNGIEFVNQTLCEYYEKVGISHETFVARSLWQNGVLPPQC